MHDEGLKKWIPDYNFGNDKKRKTRLPRFPLRFGLRYPTPLRLQGMKGFRLPGFVFASGFAWRLRRMQGEDR